MTLAHKTEFPHSGDAERAATLASRFTSVRARTMALGAPLSPEDQQLQSMTGASPTKWHLAHTTWFFDTLVLPLAHADQRRWVQLFNSYYDSLDSHSVRMARQSRGLLSRPSLAEVHDYRATVERRLLGQLEAGDLSDAQFELLELGIAHEEQHQELILTDIKHALFQNPMLPAYDPTSPIEAWPNERASGGAGGGTAWIEIDEVLAEIGHPASGAGFSFDHEQPRHRVLVAPFSIARQPITASAYLQFIEDDGYRRPELWLDSGFAACQAEGWRAPLYWRHLDDGWQVYTLAGLRPLVPDEPVHHVSYYEADAFARWSGARLPSEFEWEVAAAAHGGALPRGGLGWEWTMTAFGPYPGFTPASGPAGEYNGKFMSDRFVLRGGSRFTPPRHLRPTYRNYFAPATRWQRSGIRLAKHP